MPVLSQSLNEFDANLHGAPLFPGALQDAALKQEVRRIQEII